MNAELNDILYGITLIVLLLSIIAGAVRVVRAGTLADRVIGVDVALLGMVGAMALHAATTGRTWLLEALPVIGLLAVLGTLAIARGLSGGDR